MTKIGQLGHARAFLSCTAATFLSSSPPLLHHLHKILEQVMRVMRTGRCFGVILHAEKRQRAVAQAFERVVVQIDVGQLDIALLERIGIDSEVVVVRGDLNLAALKAFHRMIAAVVPELQLVCPATECETDELMSQTNAEDRSLAHEATNVVTSVVDRLWIARP